MWGQGAAYKQAQEFAMRKQQQQQRIQNQFFPGKSTGVNMSPTPSTTKTARGFTTNENRRTSEVRQNTTFKQKSGTNLALTKENRKPAQLKHDEDYGSAELLLSLQELKAVMEKVSSKVSATEQKLDDVTPPPARCSISSKQVTTYSRDEGTSGQLSLSNFTRYHDRSGFI